MKRLVLATMLMVAPAVAQESQQSPGNSADPEITLSLSQINALIEQGQAQVLLREATRVSREANERAVSAAMRVQQQMRPKPTSPTATPTP